MTDLHIHTSLSFDSEELAQNYIDAASAKGDIRLGFAEHCDYDALLQGYKTELCDLSAYAKQISALDGARGVKLLKGLEIGYSRAAEPHYKEILKQPFDYVICSVHTVEGRGDCYYGKFFEGLTKRQAYEVYLKAVLDSVRTELNIQIIGHLGYVARYAPYEDKTLSYKEYSGLIDEILSCIISRGLCLEINTNARGLCGGFLPGVDILERYFELGGRNITLGSDAHVCADYSRGFETVKKFLLNRGITRTCYFENRILKYEKL